MPKETFYFSHDYNARNDKKISALVRDFKSAGYGVFWCVAEMLHEEGGEIEWDDLTISAISKDLNEDFDLVRNIIEKCVSKFKLFNISEDNILTASRVKRNLDKRKSISEIRSKAGKTGANAKQMLANAEQNQAKEIKEKEIKEKENKGNDILIIEERGNNIRKQEDKKINNSFNTMPVPENFNGLPKNTKKAAAEIVYRMQAFKISDEDQDAMWEVFKIQNLTGHNWYANESKVYTHYINWIKKQKFENNGNKINNASDKSAGAASKSKIDALRNY